MTVFNKQMINFLSTINLSLKVLYNQWCKYMLGIYMLNCKILKAVGLNR